MADYTNKQDGADDSVYESSSPPFPTSHQDDDFIAPDIDIHLPDEAPSDFEAQSAGEEFEEGEYQESISDIDEELSVALQRSATPTEVTIP
ncbi:MAG: hypothetical protein IIX96_01615, partial [Clostridia bacterium]|nr:hypothetical protein [Clostridia bacterium]